MPVRELIAESTTPDGESLTLTLENGEHVVRVRGETLMTARMSGSEQAMATLAAQAGKLGAAARVLIGGLGMGFTLRAVLDQAAADATIVVSELLPDVVAWNRGQLASLAQRPLDDPRVAVRVGDLLDCLVQAQPAAAFDAILLDIDNGPEAFTVRSNERLYQRDGLRLLRAALRDGGVIVLWSAFRSLAFERRMRSAGFAVRSETVRARAGVGKGARHTLFFATATAGAAPVGEVGQSKARRRRKR